MRKARPPYGPEFRRQLIEMVRAGQKPEGVARNMSLRRRRSATGSCKRMWRRGGSETASLREGGGRWTRSCKRSGSFERSGRSCQEPRPGSVGRAFRSHRNVGIREEQPGLGSSGHDVPPVGGLQQRLLCVAQPSRRRREDEKVTKTIRAILEETRGT